MNEKAQLDPKIIVSIVIVGLTMLVMSTFALINTTFENSLPDGEGNETEIDNFFLRNGTFEVVVADPDSVEVVNNSWLSFDGVDDVVTVIPEGTYLNSSNVHFQLSGWFLINDNTTLRGIAGNNQAGNFGVYVGVSSTGNLTMFIGRGEDSFSLSYPTIVNENQWYFFAALLNDTTATLYLNDNSASGIYGALQDSAASLEIGSIGESASPWSGSLDEMRLSTMSVAELPADYISDLYLSGRVYNNSLPFPVESDGLFWMSFDENQGTITNNHLQRELI